VVTAIAEAYHVRVAVSTYRTDYIATNDLSQSSTDVGPARYLCQLRKSCTVQQALCRDAMFRISTSSKSINFLESSLAVLAVKLRNLRRLELQD
jgi:hypothetical protein